jgi:hypothetical protein
MNHKAGDTVRIRSKEWIDAQVKDRGGDIKPPPDGSNEFISYMFVHAGKIANIIELRSDGYILDLDHKSYIWEDWMFDNPASDPLTAEDAIRAMLDGETLYDKDGHLCRWNGDRYTFEIFVNIVWFMFAKYDGLYRRPKKRKWPMTNAEAKAWSERAESQGWMVRCFADGEWSLWHFPRQFFYWDPIEQYQRARIKPDLSEIDEGTIQGFEVEE